LVMTVVPARVAGVKDIVVMCPRPTPVVLAAAVEAGATAVYALGGAQAIAALAYGTESIARAIAASKAFSIAGGGDTIAAIHKFGVTDGIDYISTAGGAFLEFLEGKTLPAVAALEERA